MAHHFMASLAVRPPSPYHDEDEFDKQAKTTSENGDTGNVHKSHSLEMGPMSMGETGKGTNAEGSQGDDVETCQHGEDDDEIDDDHGSDLDVDDDINEGTSEDEDRSEFDPDYDFNWLEPIDVEVTRTAHPDEHGKPMMVAYCNAKLIRRGQMRDDFYGQMEQPSRETSMLAFDLFDRYGRLRTEYKTHPVIKGTGVWGQELDHGDILLIETVFVNKDYRRQGLGRRMVESLLIRVREKTWSFFAFAWPTVLRLNDLRQELDNLPDDAEREKLEDREHDRATTFHRSLGFRRVGSTIWFALAPKSDHPSHQLTSTEDFNPPKPPSTSLHSALTPLQQIADPPPSPLDRIWNPQPRESPDYLDVLQNCMRENGSADACWMSKDKHGNTVLHLTASVFDVACVEWALKQDFGARLLEMRNNRGETPLELVQFKLEKLRTQKVVNQLTIPVSDQFEGHDNNAIRCLVLLKGLGSVKSLIELQGQDALRRIARGCTCGQCLKGFLSPRMSHALISQAQIGHDMMNDDPHVFLGLDWVDNWEHYLGYLPSRVLDNLRTNKSMRQGFANLWLHVATCLEKGAVPNTSNVLKVVESAGEWPPATRNFLQRGGTVESVFLAICRDAMQQDEWTGDGEHLGIFSEEIAKLPECRNDHEFGYVSGMCGYRRICLRTTVDIMGNRLDEDGNMIDSLL
jgi:GNAT superfamily N-acetyltransferase